MGTKKKNRLPKLLAAGIALILIAAAAAKLPGVWRDFSFGWEARTDTELQVKAYADEHGEPIPKALSPCWNETPKRKTSS